MQLTYDEIIDKLDLKYILTKKEDIVENLIYIK